MNTDLEAHQAGWIRNIEPPLGTRTYLDIADALDVRLCSRECILRSLAAHTQGYVLGDGIVHWKDRLLVRRGLYKFLKLVAWDRSGVFAPHTRAELLWMQASGAYHLGLDVGVRFPREFAETDRAQVREALHREGWKMDHELKTRIERWASGIGEAPG